MGSNSTSRSGIKYQVERKMKSSKTSVPYNNGKSQLHKHMDKHLSAKPNHVALSQSSKFKHAALRQSAKPKHAAAPRQLVKFKHVTLNQSAKSKHVALRQSVKSKHVPRRQLVRSKTSHNSNISSVTYIDFEELVEDIHQGFSDYFHHGTE